MGRALILTPLCTMCRASYCFMFCVQSFLLNKYLSDTLQRGVTRASGVRRAGHNWQP